MIRNISIGIDIGSTTTRVVVGEFVKGEGKGERNPKVIGIGEAETHGMRHGYVENAPLVLASLKKAVLAAETSSGIRIKRAFVALGGTSLRGDIGGGSAIVSKADGEVTELDIAKALEDGENNLTLGNRKVIQSIPLSYRLDGKEVMGRLVGMRGTKLEVKGLFVNYSMQHLEDLLEVVENAGVEVIDAIPAPVAASMIALSEKQKIVGSALVNIGSETVSLAIFENGLLCSLRTFSIGSADITNDLALGFKIPLEKAESLKLGSGNDSSEEYPKKKLHEIVEARLGDIFELIENHLKKIKRSELLPAGVVFVGGGANVAGLEEFSKDALRLPSVLATSELFGNSKTKLRDSAWFTALGLILTEPDQTGYSDSGPSFFKNFKKTLRSSLKQLMP